jgi:hypothetical protein
LGSLEHFKRTTPKSRKLGKVNTPLDKNLKNVEWGEFNIIDVFDVKNTGNILSRDIIENSGQTPYLCASAENNAVSSFISYDEKYLDKGNCIFIGGKTFVVTYQENDFYSNDSHNLVLYLKDISKRTKVYQLFLAACINKSLSPKYSWGDSISRSKIQKDRVSLPIKNGKIDFKFIKSLIAEIERELSAELDAYLSITELNSFILTDNEQNAINNFDNLKWQTFKLEKLFGKSTRGKRLKSSDRISGSLPFVTAGETEEGVSAFIGNDVNVFPENTTTIDMFGSAKYRNYKYGGDDHIAVVHTEKLPKFASIFVTSAIHKASYNGQFNYGKNFYAKDADVLEISLPAKGQEPDFLIMEVIISAIHKLIIKEVILYFDKKNEESKKILKELTIE